MVKFYLFSLFFSFTSVMSFAQYFEDTEAEANIINDLNTGVNFSNQNNMLSTQGISSILIVGVADMNGDKLDDIIRLDSAKYLTIEYQTHTVSFSNFEYGDISDIIELTLSVADVDGNGFNDMIIGGNADGVKLLLANDDGSDYTESVLPGSEFFVQGSNFADINNDGLVDIFICDDDAESKVWENTGNGNFTLVNDWIDMTTDPTSDNSGNYASAWTDFDNDGDLDLYISKCRSGVDVPTDPRRINALYVNDGNGNFSEMAEEYNLKSGAQSWTSDFQDIDNDGDLDCFIVNHYEACRLLENDGTGHYTDITVSSGVNINSNPLQGIMRDFNNDGYMDILVAGNAGYEVYENNGDGTFDLQEDVFGNYLMGTFAIGDLNYDGFLDIYSGSPAMNTSDVLWINEKNDNNYFAVTLESTTGNRNAIGSRVEIYGDWGIQIREVRSGESYGINNSFTQYFGLGLSETIDSLIVKWPSGNVEVFENPAINQFLNITENDCAYPGCFIFDEEGTQFCSGDTLYLEAPHGSIYNWSNGETSKIIPVTESGFYQVTVENSFGCTSVSVPVLIEQDPDTIPVITALDPTVFCQGDVVRLFSSEAYGYEWSTGSESRFILVSQTGDYSVTVTGLCEELSSEVIHVEVVNYPEIPMVENDTINDTPASGTLVATGENLIWYNAPFNGDELGTGNTFTTDLLLETTAFYVSDATIFDDVTCRGGRVEASVVLDSTTLTRELDYDDVYTIFPNPANEYIIVEAKEAYQNEIVIRIYNILGQLVFESNKAVLEHRLEIPVQSLSEGMYTVTIDKGEEVLFKNLIISRE